MTANSLPPESGKSYAQYGVAATSARFIPENLLRLLPDDKTVDVALDIGSGTGISTREILRRYPHCMAFALEPQDSMREHARREDPPSVIHLNGSAEDLAHLDIPRLDLVMCSSAIWHTDLPRLLGDVASRLKSGGHFVFNIGESFIALPPTTLPAGNRQFIVELLRAGFELGMAKPEMARANGHGTGKVKQSISGLRTVIGDAELRITRMEYVDQTVDMQESKAWAAIPMYAHTLPGLTVEQCRQAFATAMARMSDDAVISTRWVMVAVTGSSGHGQGK